MTAQRADDELPFELLAGLFEGQPSVDQVVDQERQIFFEVLTARHYFKISMSPGNTV